MPISGAAFDRLGKRLADGASTDSDLDQFTEIRLAYGRALEVVQAGLADVGLPATGRVKTTGTLVEKLRRTPGLTIRGVHDLAGCRVVLQPSRLPVGTAVGQRKLRRALAVPDGRFVQDFYVHQVTAQFGLGQHDQVSKAPKLLDRRQSPSAGYRAVHVVVFVGGLPVEIQLRTQLQHRWAEAAERLGDSWGRGLRYGSGPDDPEQQVEEGFTRSDLVSALGEVSDGVARYEEIQAKLDDAELLIACSRPGPSLVKLQDAVEDIRGDMRAAKEATEHMLRTVADLVERLG